MNPIVSHKKSNTVVNGQPLLPTPEEIRVGEITVNYAAGHETLAIKNDEDEIVSFQPVDITEIEKDETVIAYAISSLYTKDNELSKKLKGVHTEIQEETSRATSAETDIIEHLQDTVQELGKDLTVIAHAISTLNKRILQMETYFTSMTTPTTSETGYTSAVFEFTE